MKSRATITIDGRTFSGSSISIRNGKVVIDGVEQDGTLSGVVEVRIVEGAIEHLHSDMSVTCGDVTGNATAGMELHCGNVGGNAIAGMDLKCGTVGGSVNAGMGVTMRK